MSVGVLVSQRPTERLRDSVDELVDVDPADLSDRALADELLARRRQIDRQEASFARLAFAAHQRGVGAVDGAASTASWMRHRAGMREGDAKVAIENGEVTEILSETGQAWRAGEISTGAARTIISARVEGHDDTLIACEPEFLALARRNELRVLKRAVDHFRNLARADGTEPSEQDGLYVSPAFNGRTVISGELSDVAAETVVTTLNAYMDPPSEDDTRTPAQRRAAALVRVCEVALAHAADAGKPRAHVSFVVDWKTLTKSQPGRLDGQFTGAIHPQDIERLLCDSSISRIVTGPDSLPLNVGRTRRTIPPSIRRALVERDQGCRFRGCNRPPGWCDAHHLKHWKDGGTTDLSNLALFCDHHHHVLHQPGWRVQLDGHDIRVFRPDGTQVLE